VIEGRLLRSRPRLQHFEGFVDAATCNELVAALSVPRLLDAGVDVRYGPTGRTAEVPTSHHPALSALVERFETLVGLPSAVPPTFRVRHAAPGDAHPPHLDCYEAEGAWLVATVMVWLDLPGCVGGRTTFPEAEPPLALEGRPGDVAVWFNYTADGRPDPSSRHLMERVEAGGRLTMNYFLYARPEDVARATGLAAVLRDDPFWRSSRRTLVCIDDTAAAASAASLAEACRLRGVTFDHRFARTVDPREGPLEPGTMLYCVSTSAAAERVERQLWQPGVRTFHRSPEGPFTVALDPLRRYARAGLPVPRWLTLEPGSAVPLAELVEWLGGFPVVVKSPGGEGGLGTMRADSLPALTGLVEMMCAQGTPPTLLAYVPEALHLRVIVVGDRAVTAYRNPLRPEDFRSMPSAAASDYDIELPPDVAELAVEAAHIVGTDFAGVDILLHESGRAYVLEANFPCFFPQAERFGVSVAGAMLAYLLGPA
jgi:hypothetical protein